MSFAIYGESPSYVHLVSGDTRNKAINAFIADVQDVGADLASVYNLFAVENAKEDLELEDFIRQMIEEASVKPNQ